ncbi:MAG: diguanylate cyclase [Halioglobus sp.]|nr:diguanylate cyclase [Halioglobus sp.]
MTCPDKLIDWKLQLQSGYVGKTMEQIQPQNWAAMFFAMVILMTFALMAVVYVLSDASNPTGGLGLYTVYFMAALLGWIAFALQRISNVPMAVDVPSVASIINSYILFMAASERAGISYGRYALGCVCLAGCFSVFFVGPDSMFVIQAIAATLFFSATGLLCARRSWQKHNAGDAITASAALLMVSGTSLGLYYWVGQERYDLAYILIFGSYSAAYVLVAIGFMASVVIEYQHRLSYLALEDPLTQLLNRRGLEKALHITLAQTSRRTAPTAAVMVDIDQLREVNDNFGHDTGDLAIRQVAQLLQRISRSGDVAARIGGEEFLLVLPGTDLDGALTLAERIHSYFSDAPVTINQQRIPITVSLGVAAATGAIELDMLSQEANRAMTLAKRGGRNQVASIDNKPVLISTDSTRS